MNYFVSYHYTDIDGRDGIGNSDVAINKEITNIETIREIESTLKDKFNRESVVILNYIKLSGD